ncbi:XdhC family protein [Arcobacter sp. YIC-310]|uniref:XdhC family protein n=1 Tax=Arcobacter sp. YIC-310 TaxID=3376632 RepID=UPI003C1EDB1A
MFNNKEYLSFIEKSKKDKLDIVVTSVVNTLGSTYAKSGNMMLINSNFESVGVLGSPALHKKILDLSKQTLNSKEIIFFKNEPKSKSSGHGISNYLVEAFFYEDDYSALGEALVNIGKTLVRNIYTNEYSFLDKKSEIKFENNLFYQSIEFPYSLLIFGSGDHVTSLVEMANLMGWQTTVIDTNIKKQTVLNADYLIQLDKIEDISNMDLTTYNSSVILSHSPTKDDIYLEALLKSKVEYIGVLGNKKNMQKKKNKFNLENDKRFYAPVGLDIGGTTHQSIALSICSQIEARKNGKI